MMCCHNVFFFSITGIWVFPLRSGSGVSVMVRWVVAGISGVTCSGKTTLAQRLHHMLPVPSTIVSQDNYFYPENSSHHVPAPGGINFHNWEVITSVDMERMLQDIRNIIEAPPAQYKRPPTEEQDPSLPRAMGENPIKATSSSDTTAILLLDGFLLFGHGELTEVCDLRYFLTLTQEECWERRQTRHYDPPDPPGYFQQCVWPEYQRHLEHVKEVGGVRFLDGMATLEVTTKLIFDDILNHLKK